MSDRRTAAVVLPLNPKEVQLLLSLLHGRSGVCTPQEVNKDVAALELEGGYHLHTLPVDGQRGVVFPALPEVRQ